MAQNFDQTERYSLISISGSEIKGLNGSHDIQTKEIKINLNENYILLISKLIDENFGDVIQLTSELKANKEDSKSSHQAPFNEEHYAPEPILKKEMQKEDREGLQEDGKKYHFQRLFEDKIESIH